MTDTAGMGQREHGTDEPRRNRRTLLGVIATATAGVLAGCSSGGDGNSGSDDDNSDTGASGEGCPSLPLSATEKRIEGSPSLVFEGPAAATYEISSEGTDGVGSATVTFPQANDGGSWLIQIGGVTQDRETVVEAIEGDSLTETAEEVTGDYDLPDDSTRVFLLEQQSSFSVYLPGESEVVQVTVSPIPGPSDVACTDAATMTVDLIIETLHLVE